MPFPRCCGHSGQHAWQWCHPSGHWCWNKKEGARRFYQKEKRKEKYQNIHCLFSKMYGCKIMQWINARLQQCVRRKNFQSDRFWHWKLLQVCCSHGQKYLSVEADIHIEDFFFINLEFHRHRCNTHARTRLCKKTRRDQKMRLSTKMKPNKDKDVSIPLVIFWGVIHATWWY